jgi:hypothetical protein
MSNSQPNRREIVRLEEVPRSATPEPAPKKQRTSRSTSRIPQSACVKDTSDRSRGTRASRSMGTVDHAEPACVKDTSDRSSEPSGHQRATPGGDLAEAGVDDARAADHAEPASVKDTPDRSSEPLESPALMEQAAWDASVMPISTGMDVEATPIAAVAVTGDISVRPASTGVDTDTRAGTRAFDSDRGVASGTEGTSSQCLSEEDSSDIAGRGPRTEATSASVHGHQ